MSQMDFKEAEQVVRRTEARQQDTARMFYFLPDLEDGRLVVWLEFRIKRLLLDPR